MGRYPRTTLTARDDTDNPEWLVGPTRLLRLALDVLHVHPPSYNEPRIRHMLMPELLQYLTEFCRKHKNELDKSVLIPEQTRVVLHRLGVLKLPKELEHLRLVRGKYFGKARDGRAIPRNSEGAPRKRRGRAGQAKTRVNIL